MMKHRFGFSSRFQTAASVIAAAQGMAHQMKYDIAERFSPSPIAREKVKRGKGRSRPMA